MVDRQHRLARPRVALLALVALVAARSLVEGTNAASDLLRQAVGFDDYPGLVHASRRGPMIGRTMLTSNNETIDLTSFPGPLTPTGSTSVNRSSGGGESRTGDDVIVDLTISNGKMELTSMRDELFEDEGDGDTGNGKQNDVELWNTSTLTELDLLPEELSYSVKTFFAVSYGVIVLTSVVFNSLVIFVVIVSSKLRTVTNVFFVSLAVSDLLIAVVNMPFQLLSVLRNEWTVGGEPLCQATNYVQGVVLVSSLLTLTGIAVDRYYAICRPLEARHLHTVRRATVLVGVFWVLSAVVVAPQLVVQRLEPVLVLDLRPPMSTTPDDSVSAVSGTVVPVATVRVAYQCVEYFPELRWNIAYTLFYYLVLYVLPMLTMFIAYGRIAITLWRRTPPGEQLEHEVSSEASAKRLNERKRIVRMLVIIVGLFTLSWFPFFTTQVYMLFVDYSDQASPPSADTFGTSTSLRTVNACLQLVAYTNCAVNPIVYCLLNERFQQRMRKMLRSLVRLLAARGRQRQDLQQRQRRRTLSETLPRINSPTNVANASSGTVINGLNGIDRGTVITVRNGAVDERPDGLEMNCDRRKLNFASGNPVKSRMADEEDESSDEFGNPFTPSTEELPVCNLFVDGELTAVQFSSNSGDIDIDVNIDAL